LILASEWFPKPYFFTGVFAYLATYVIRTEQISIKMTKAEIRKQETARRMELSFEQLTALSEKLLLQFTTLNFQDVQTIHLFLPIEEKNEPDTFMLIKWLKASNPGIKIIVPKADFTTSLMTHHPYQGEEELQKSLFNILEPVLDEQYTGKIDIVLVPLLAFDSRGYRVGYGKGFYDRFMEGLDALKVGVSLFESVDIIADTHDNDVKLDLCLTPEKIYDFMT
jgi:5-formyltetrahydrofolate cyclo-ligase